MDNRAPFPIVSDWHERYVADRPLRYLLRLFSPGQDNFLWGLFLKKLQHHRHGLGTNAILSTWLLALVCAYIPSGVFSFHVWYLFYLCYLPVAAIKTARSVEVLEVASELRQTPQGEATMRQALVSMGWLVTLVALVPAALYVSLKALGFAHSSAKLPTFEISFLLVSVGAMASGSITMMRLPRIWALVPALVGLVGIFLVYPGLRIEHIIFVQVPPMVKTSVATGFAGTALILGFQWLWAYGLLKWPHNLNPKEAR